MFLKLSEDLLGRLGPVGSPQDVEMLSTNKQDYFTVKCVGSKIINRRHSVGKRPVLGVIEEECIWAV